MTSIVLIEWVSYSFFLILLTGAYFIKFLLKKSKENNYFFKYVKPSSTLLLSSLSEVTIMILIQFYLFYTLKLNSFLPASFNFVLISYCTLLFGNILLSLLTNFMSILNRELIIVTKVSVLLIVIVLSFIIVTNMLLLLFVIELSGVAYFFYLLNPKESPSLSKIQYKNVISLYLWNSFFLLILLAVLLTYTVYTIGTLDFNEIIILSDTTNSSVYGVMLLILSWKVGAPGFHFFKFQLYSIINNVTLLIFSSYTLFINIFILFFILFAFKSVLITNQYFLLVYILIINVILLTRTNTLDNVYLIFALSSVNTWCSLIVFGLINC